MNSYSQLLQLRQQLQERYPGAHRNVMEEPGESSLEGVPCLEVVGGIPEGKITEVVAVMGSGLFLSGVLKVLRRERKRAVLVDGRDSFDPQTMGEEWCRDLLWVRCREVTQAIKAADLVLRDGNLPFTILDLQLNAPHELGEIPRQTWYRLRNLAEEASATLLVITALRTVPCAALRLELDTRMRLESLETPRRELEEKLRARVIGGQYGKGNANEERRMAS